MTQFYLPPWVAGYIPVVCPPKDSHPSQYLLTNIVVAEIELITIELQVRRPNDIVNELNQSVNEKKINSYSTSFGNSYSTSLEKFSTKVDIFVQRGANETSNLHSFRR